MKNRKWIAAAGTALSIGMMMAGCAKTGESPQAEVREMFMEGGGPGESLPEDTGQIEEDADQKADTEQDAEEQENERQDADEAGETEQDADESGSGQTVNISHGKEHLGGKVQSPQADGMTLAQTTLLDEDGQVILLEVKDAKKIPVKFTAETKVEHWTIQGGGADIDMKEALFSDLEEGMGVELEGYYEDETFVATRVIIEVYV